MKELCECIRISSEFFTGARGVDTKYFLFIAFSIRKFWMAALGCCKVIISTFRDVFIRKVIATLACATPVFYNFTGSFDRSFAFQATFGNLRLRAFNHSALMTGRYDLVLNHHYTKYKVMHTPMHA